MPLSSAYLAEVAKYDPLKAEAMRDGTHRPPNLDYGNRPTVETRDLTESEIEIFEAWQSASP